MVTGLVAAAHGLSSTPVVALAVSLLVAAVVCVFILSYLFYWRSRSGRRQ